MQVFVCSDVAGVQRSAFDRSTICFEGAHLAVCGVAGLLLVGALLVMPIAFLRAAIRASKQRQAVHAMKHNGESEHVDQAWQRYDPAAARLGRRAGSLGRAECAAVARALHLDEFDRMWMEMAPAMDTSPGNVESMMDRGREKLRRMHKECLYPQPLHLLACIFSCHPRPPVKVHNSQLMFRQVTFVQWYSRRFPKTAYDVLFGKYHESQASYFVVNMLLKTIVNALFLMSHHADWFNSGRRIGWPQLYEAEQFRARARYFL
jgi:hypothetical protein